MSCPSRRLISRKAKKVHISYKRDDKFYAKKMTEPKDVLVEVHEYLIGETKYLLFNLGEQDPWMVKEKEVEWFEIDNEHISVGMGSFLR